jgi:hypothetical protein
MRVGGVLLSRALDQVADEHGKGDGEDGAVASYNGPSTYLLSNCRQIRYLDE